MRNLVAEEAVARDLEAAEEAMAVLVAVVALFAAEVAMAALKFEVQPPCYPLGW